MIAEGYNEHETRVLFARGKSYDEFQRQPLHRQAMSEILFEIVAKHPWLKMETSFSHGMYGFYIRLVGTRYGRTHLLYTFDETLKIMRYSYEDAIDVPLSFDNLRDAITAVEEILDSSV